MRGLAIALPSILTLVILIWLISLVTTYIISPTSYVVRLGIAGFLENSVESKTLSAIAQPPPLPYCDVNYLVKEEDRINFNKRVEEIRARTGRTPDERSVAKLINLDETFVKMGAKAVPYRDYEEVAKSLSESKMPRTSLGLYMELVLFRHFRRVFLLNLFVVLILLAIIYFLGRVVSVRLGSWFISLFERKVIAGLPVVRNVYGSVKQITDFLFTENQIEYRRVVAIEYPRPGIWSLGFVTGESMKQIVKSAGEECVTILIPTSPMPMTGYTISVPKTAVLDLDLTVEQAFQFCVSCGVLVPPQQKISTTTNGEQPPTLTLPEANNADVNKENENTSPDDNLTDNENATHE